jgi:hypothetical protein
VRHDPVAYTLIVKRELPLADSGLRVEQFGGV